MGKPRLFLFRTSVLLRAIGRRKYRVKAGERRMRPTLLQGKGQPLSSPRIQKGGFISLKMKREMHKEKEEGGTPVRKNRFSAKSVGRARSRFKQKRPKRGKES